MKVRVIKEYGGFLPQFFEAKKGVWQTIVNVKPIGNGHVCVNDYHDTLKEAQEECISFAMKNKNVNIVWEDDL